MRKSLLILILLLLPVASFADGDGILIDGIYYNLSETEATVTEDPFGPYTGDIIIPSAVTFEEVEYSVTSIGEYAFEECSGLTSINLSDNIKYIEEGAFKNCSSLTSITIPNNVTSIGKYAFSGCSGLTSINLSDNIKYIKEGAFSDCSGLTSIVVSNGNEKYDSRNNCNAIIEKSSNMLIAGCRNTIIPNNVTGIGNYAFSGCSGLSSINIPNNVTSIGRGAFSGCSGLTSIVVSNGNEKYDSRNNCNAIIEKSSNMLIAGCRNTIIPNNVTSIGSFAFDSCSGLTSITIPDGVTGIGDFAFRGCSALTSITIPDGVTLIGNSAFQDCSSLTSITIPDGVTSIGQLTFQRCSSLTSITIPDGVTSIGLQAFYACHSLTSINIPNSVITIGRNAFICRNLRTVIIQNENPLRIIEDGFDMFSNRANATLYVPTGAKAAYQAADYWKEFKEIIEMKAEGPVRVINVETAGTLSQFISDEDKYNITDLTITGRLNGTDFRLLRAMAGNDYTGHPTEGKLEKLDLSGATIVAGGNYAEFENNLCNLGDERTVSAYISEFIDNSLPECLFLGCSKLQEIKLPSSIVAIQTGAFRHTGLTSFVIPKSTTTLGTALFSFCDNLTSLDVESDNTTYWAKDNAIIETSTKRLVVACKNTTIPSEVLIIGQNAFYNSGETIVLPSNLNKIESSAFSTTSLKSINIPASVSVIEGGAFASCDDLIEITVNEGNTKYESPEGSNAIIEKITKTLVAGCQSTVIPLDVTAIGAGAFLNNINKSFISIALPASITSIGSEAFYSCAGLTSINLPSTLETIGDNAFAECSNLTSVTIGAETPLVITADIFTNRANATLYVPTDSKAAYQAADYWKEFKEIVEVEAPSGNIVFASNAVKEACVERWDTNSDGELSYAEAAAVTSFTNFTAGDSEFSFDEFLYFTGVTSLNNNSFSNRENLTSIILPSSIISIGREAFRNSKITSINLGDLSNLTTIDTQAFSDCYRLTEVTLPANIRTMGSSIFTNCYNIVKVVSNIAVPLPNSGENSIIDIGNDAVLYVPEGTADAYKAAGWKESFFDIQSFRVITEGNSTDPVAREGLVYGGSDIWMGGNTQGQRLIYPGTYRDGMMEYSLDGSTYSTSVPLGKDAGEYTVYYRKVGESVASTLQVTIALSGNIVFASDKVKAACVAKWDTDDDKQLSYAEARAVTCLIEDPRNSDDDPFAQLWVEDSEFSFDEFQYFTGVTSLTGYEFADCENLTSIILPNSITSIGEGAFSRCKKLTSIHIPASVTNIHMGGEVDNEETVPAFISSYLQTITVDSENTKYSSPEGSNVIIDTENNTLILGCGNTDFTKIPNTVTTIGQEAFAGVTFANTIVSLPISVTGIMKCAFMHSNITSINLGELSNLTTIGTQAFAKCTGLTEVTLPASITQMRTNEDGEGIGISVFADCYNIIKVVSNIEEPFKNGEQYNNSNYYIFAIQNDAVLYVPAGKKQAYINRGWKEIDDEIQSFREITDGNSTDPEAIDGLVYNGSNQKLILPGTYRIGMMEYSLDDITYSTSVPTGKEAGEYTIYYRKVGESGFSTLQVTIAAPQTISVFSGSNLWAGYVAAEDLALPTGLEAYVITNLGATTATASSLNYIPQGVPVLLKRNNASVNDYEISTGTGTAPTVNLLKTYDSDKSVSNREGFILYNDEFVLVNEGTLPAGRLFLPANGSGRALTRTIVFDRDDIVDFGDSQEKNDDSNQWYDIQGRKLERKPTKKGIYILDGRKVVIK